MADNETLYAVGKLRWVKKDPDDPLVIKNFEAHRLMCQSIIFDGQEGKQDEALKKEMAAINVLERELREYLAGVRHVPAFSMHDAYQGSGPL